MKILGISGGRKNSNNDAICREALKGAVSVGAEVEFINLNNLNLQHCNGCSACVMSLMLGNGGACVIKDDFEWLRDKMMDADGIVWAIPIFESGAMGLFHTIMDRMGPRNDRGMVTIGSKNSIENEGPLPDQRILKDKVVSYMAVGGSDWMHRVECDFLTQAMTPAWTVVDMEVFSWASCLIVDDEKMDRAYQIGVELANSAKDIPNAKYLGKPGVCPHCQCREFYIEDSGQAVCCSCGLIGELVLGEGKPTFRFDPLTESLAHDTLSGKFKHADDIGQQSGKMMLGFQSDKFKKIVKAHNEFIQPSMPER